MSNPPTTSLLLHKRYYDAFAAVVAAARTPEGEALLFDLCTSVEKFTLTDSIVPSMNCQKPLPAHRNQKWEIAGGDFLTDLYVNNLMSYTTETGYFEVIGFAIPWFAPANTLVNAAAVFFHKSCKVVLSDDETQERRFVDTPGSQWLLEILSGYPPSTSGEFHQAALTHIQESDKRQLYTAYLDKYEWSPLCNPQYMSFRYKQPTLNLMIKFDEVLVSGKSPRPINNQTIPITMATMHIVQVSNTLKSIFDGSMRVITAFGHTFHLYLLFSGGGDVDILSDWFTRHRADPHPHIGLACCGDDTICEILWPADSIGNGKLFFYEGDLSACDQSLRRGAILFGLSIYKALGVPQECLDLLYNCAASYMRFENKEGTVVFSNGNWDSPRDEWLLVRQTGGTDTSIGNTICLANAWMSIFFNSVPPAEWEETFAYYGLNLKLLEQEISPSSPYSGTFLKGRFVQSALDLSKYFWAPLPSLFVKLGKVMTDPRVIVSSRRHRVKDYDQACKLYLRQVFLSLDARPLDWFMTEVKSRLKPSPDVKVPRAAKTVPIFGYGYLAPAVKRSYWVSTVEESLGYMEFRYGLTAEDVHSFFDLVGSSFETATAYVHPLLFRLIYSDYG
jgi:hypothetical protein